MRHAPLRRLVVVASACAVLSLGPAALAAGVPPAKATANQREQAQARFLKGKALYEMGSHEAALVELRASLEIVASPNTRLYVGRALRELGRLTAAHAELGRAVGEARELKDARYEKTAEVAIVERGEIASRLGMLDVRISHASPETTLRVAGEVIPQAGWAEPIALDPGEIQLQVETPGRPPIARTVTVVAGARPVLAIDAVADAAPAVAETAPVAPNEGPPPILRPLAFATAGLAVVGLGTFLVAGAMANGSHGDLEDACGAGPCPPGREGDIEAGKTQQTVANVGLAIFVVSAAASVTLFVVSSKRASAPPAAAVPRVAPSALAPSARVVVGPSFTGLQGAF